MKDVSRKELQDVVEGICKYCSNNRNYLAQDLYRQMNRDDYLGRFGHICCHNSRFDIDIKLTKRKHCDEDN